MAGDLAKMNFAVTILEGQSEPGGILLFGIPEFRLQKDVVRREITELLHLGVEIKTNMLVGPDLQLMIYSNRAMMLFLWVQALLCHVLRYPR